MSLSNITNSLSSAQNAIAAAPASIVAALPQLPTLPTFPSIPQLPSVPNLSNLLPSLPSLPSIPGLPSLPGLGALLGGSKSKSKSASATNAVDVVGVFDDSFNQLFNLARPIKANINPSSKIMDHPIEGGATSSDFRIILPTEIELSLICSSDEYKSAYQQIKTVYLAGQTVTVKTRADTYLNMMISGMPHDETPDMYNAIAVALKLREIIFVTTQYQSLPPSQVQNSDDQSTVKAGEATPKTPSLAFQGLAAAKSLVSGLIH